MQFRVEALPTSQMQPARNPFEGQRRLPPQPRGDRQFDRVALEPLLKASFLPDQPPQFLRQNPLAFGFRALPLQLPSVVLRMRLTKHVWFQGSSSHAPAARARRVPPAGYLYCWVVNTLLLGCE